MPVNTTFAARINTLYPPHRMEKGAGRRISFDKALQMVAPRLSARQRRFLATVAGFAEADAFDVATIEPLEDQRTALVRWSDSAWKRHVGRKRQMSSSYRVTEIGRMLVLSAVRLVALTKGETAQ